MLDPKKLLEVQTLSRIPNNQGEQFIHVYINITWGESGYISYGFKWKAEIGTLDFHSLDEAIKIINELRKKASPKMYEPQL